MFRGAFKYLGRAMAIGMAEHFAKKGYLKDAGARLERLESAVRELAANTRASRPEQWEAMTSALSDLTHVLRQHAMETVASVQPTDRLLTGHVTGVFSQNHEDAILAEIFGRIGTTDRRFLEIGVGDGSENTTRLLLALGWRGAWIECHPPSVAAIRQRFSREIASGDLLLIEDVITAENAADIAARIGTGEEDIDLLSVDIDMNTSHVWRALPIPARVACVEYNASFPPEVEFEVAYDPGSTWDGSNYFGASLKSLERIGHAKNMALVGCDLMGVNAFFVRRDLADLHFPGPRTAEAHFQPPRYHLSGRRGHPPASGAFRRADPGPR
ncbi:hypothetical protein KXR53_31370 [Inquilinus limosus]|uniref:hypothetical protein n=1 Tax=Inquilinus limosus TaxID=171674 RepID=UPI003F15DD01